MRLYQKSFEQICTNAQLLDWTENGVLESTLREILTSEHDNFATAWRFGHLIVLDFPSKGEWRLSSPNERCHGRLTQIARQIKIKRYNKQRITCLAAWLSEYIRDWAVGDLFPIS